MATLAIIGTAGRKDDTARLTLPVWNNMKRVIAKFVAEHGFHNAISGGAAGADHLAVGLFNARLISDLTLALPCEFDWNSGQFVDNGEINWRTNPGGTCNYYHRQFGKMIKRNTLEEIKLAIYNGAEIEKDTGFMARNSLVAKADVVIAFTFGDGPIVKDGGTADTCRKYLANGGTALWHVDLNTMTLYENGRLARTPPIIPT